MKLPIRWEGDKARASLFAVELVVFEDGDEPGKWWGEIELFGGMWLTLPRQTKPFDSKQEAQRAVEDDLERRFNLILMALKGLETA